MSNLQVVFLLMTFGMENTLKDKLFVKSQNNPET